jgi:hypothetical protein
MWVMMGRVGLGTEGEGRGRWQVHRDRARILIYGEGCCGASARRDRDDKHSHGDGLGGRLLRAMRLRLRRTGTMMVGAKPGLTVVSGSPFQCPALTPLLT